MNNSAINMDDSWLPPANLQDAEDPEVKSYLTLHRENNPLSEPEKKTRDFYLNLFAEHFKSESGDMVETESETNIAIDLNSEGDVEEAAADKTQDKIETREEACTVKLLVEACEKNHFEDIDVFEVAKSGNLSQAVLSAKGLKNLITWLAGQQLDEEQTSLSGRLVKGLLSVNSCESKRLLVEDLSVQTLVVDLLATNTNIGLVETCIAMIVSFEEGSKAEGCQAGKFVSEMVGSLNRDNPGYDACLESLLQVQPLDEFRIEVMESVLLSQQTQTGQGLLPTVAEAVGENPSLLLRLAHILKQTSNNVEVSRTTRYGKFVVNTLKKMPNQLPKEPFDVILQAVQSIKCFLKKPAEVELRKHSPV